MSMSFKASPDGTYGEILVNGQVVAKLPVSGNAVIPNLVGTVSQSGGVPTGAVVERGSNANGEYVRFADGTLIIFRFSLQLVYVSSNRLAASITYPTAFLSGNAQCLSLHSSNLSGIANTKYGFHAMLDERTPGTGRVSVIGSSGFVTGDSITVDVSISGRWY